MKEEYRIRRRMTLIIVWTLFVSLTAAGLISAYNQTRYVNEGYEAVTVRLTDIL